MFFSMSETEFASYTDDNAPYIVSDNVDDVIEILENDSIRLFKLLSDNQIKSNKDKCHLIVSNNKHISIKIDDIEIESSDYKKLLGIKINSKLTFKKHLDGVIKKATRKVNVLFRITPYMNIAKQKLFINSLFTSQFSYCCLIWMFHGRGLNNKINRLHEKYLRIVHSDNRSSFEDLLDKDKSVSVHVKNVLILTLEMFKVAQNLSAPISEIFVKQNTVCDLRNPSGLVLPKVHSGFYGKESISYLNSQIWNVVPLEMKNLTTINAFNREVKK